MTEQEVQYLPPIWDVRKIPLNIQMKRHLKSCVSVSGKTALQKLQGIYRREEKNIKELDTVIYG